MRRLEGERDAAARGRVEHQLDRLFEYARGCERLAFEWRKAPFQESETKSSIRRASRRDCRLMMPRKRRLRSGIVDTLLQGLRVAIERGQRRAQFVRVRESLRTVS